MSFLQLIFIGLLIGSGFIILPAGVENLEQKGNPVLLLLSLSLMACGVLYWRYWERVKDYFSNRRQTKKAQRRAPGQCYGCGKRLQVAPAVMFGTGADIFTQIGKSPYNCKSCGTSFCVDCMAALKNGNRICSYCKQDIGW